MKHAAAVAEAGKTHTDDIVLPFRTVRSGVIGRLVRLGPAVDEILSHHAAPAAVSQALGEAVALTAMLGTALKIDGKRAYDLARAGETVELKPRTVTIHRLELLARPDADHAVLRFREWSIRAPHAGARNVATRGRTLARLS